MVATAHGAAAALGLLLLGAACGRVRYEADGGPAPAWTRDGGDGAAGQDGDARDADAGDDGDAGDAGSTGPGFQWDVGTALADAGRLAAMSPLAFGPGGEAYAALVLEATGELVVVRFGGPTPLLWTVFLTGAAAAGSRRLGIAIDSTGQAHVCHHLPAPDAALAHTWGPTAGWGTELVHAEAGEVFATECALRVDALDGLRVAFNAEVAEDLWYGTRTGSTWDVDAVGQTGALGGAPALALRADGYAVVVARLQYASDESSGLHVRRQLGENLWASDAVLRDSGVGDRNDLALTSLAGTGIATYAGASGEIRYIEQGRLWGAWGATNLGPGGPCVSLTLDADDAPHLVYGGPLGGELLHVFRSGADWHSEPIDTGGGLGDQCAVGRFAGGELLVLYGDAVRGELRWALGTPR